jgi:putative ABC transport system substrate-binding protein
LNVQVIVANVGEAVELGIVASLARPGGNVTGSSYLMLDLVTKRLEALREILRRVRRVAVLWNPTNQVHGPALRGLETAARPLGLDLHVTAARNLDEIEATFSTIANEGVGALVVLDDGVFVHHRTRLASLALQKRLPTITGLREQVEAGGLMAYGPSLTALARRAATFVDRILKGAKPDDLPVEQATTFDLVINLRTAKALGLTIPQSFLLRADEVIQ